MKIIDRVKRDIMREIDSQQTHTGFSWADIMLRHSSRLTERVDQEAFWRWIVDPNEDREVNMTFTEIDPSKVDLATQYTTPVEEKDDEKCGEVQMENKIHREGFVTYISSKPVNGAECTSSQRQGHQDLICAD